MIQAPAPSTTPSLGLVPPRREASRAQAPRPAAEYAWRVLEEIDYGLILLNAAGVLMHANQIARQELARARFLQLEDGVVTSPSPEQTEEFMRGVRWAAQGRRQMLTLRSADQSLPVACVPLTGHAEGSDHAPVLLMLARQSSTQNLAVTFFARTHGLTPAEEAVLKALCEGMDVRDIAAAHRVTEYTVRTQVRSLRDKTGAGSMRLLVQRVAALPPVVPVSLASC